MIDFINNFAYLDEKEEPLPVIHKTLVIQTKIKYKCFVNIGNDWIFMQSKFPEFFLIKDLDKRKNAIIDYKNEQKLEDDDFDAMCSNQYQIEGHQVLKHTIARLANTFKEKSMEEILHKFSHISEYPIKELRIIYKKLKEEKSLSRQSQKSYKKMTKTIYRTIKETLCPVCCSFAWPTHTPTDTEMDDDQTIRGIPCNPFILEENFKKLDLVWDSDFSIKEAKTQLKNGNKTLRNMINQVKRQERERNIMIITCPEKDAEKCPHHQKFQKQISVNSSVLTQEEKDDIKRWAIKSSELNSCHINYLLGIDKWKAINDYLNKHSWSITNQINTERISVHISTVLDK